MLSLIQLVICQKCGLTCPRLWEWQSWILFKCAWKSERKIPLILCEHFTSIPIWKNQVTIFCLSHCWYFTAVGILIIPEAIVFPLFSSSSSYWQTGNLFNIHICLSGAAQQVSWRKKTTHYWFIYWNICQVFALSVHLAVLYPKSNSTAHSLDHPGWCQEGGTEDILKPLVFSYVVDEWPFLQPFLCPFSNFFLYNTKKTLVTHLNVSEQWFGLWPLEIKQCLLVACCHHLHMSTKE